MPFLYYLDIQAYIIIIIIIIIIIVSLALLCFCFVYIYSAEFVIEHEAVEWAPTTKELHWSIIIVIIINHLSAGYLRLCTRHKPCF
jgi:heme/copper-type cytochrome/quinol oxidase subunit 2